VDVQVKLAELRGMVEQARSRGRSGSAVVDREALLRAVDELSSATQAALAESEEVRARREEVVAEGRQEAERIVAEAHREREKLISDTDVYRVAKRQAETVVEKAHQEAEALRAETDRYVDAKLANFEITLLRTTEAVQRGRERLAGRTDFAALGPDDEETPLPEHLRP
jgi:cell division septum initiation protein DivIVA